MRLIKGGYVKYRSGVVQHTLYVVNCYNCTLSSLISCSACALAKATILCYVISSLALVVLFSGWKMVLEISRNYTSGCFRRLETPATTWVTYGMYKK